MSNKLLLACVVGAVWLGPAGALTEEPGLPPEAETLCRLLFQMLDEGSLRETYELTAPLVRTVESAAAWQGQIISERESMGAVVSRSLSHVERLEHYADLPDGPYILAVYDTDFAAHPASQEMVVLVETATGGYGLAAYRVRYNMWPEAVTIILNGFLVVCFIMGLLAAITWAVGKVVQRIEEEAKEE
jgi:hypothetical protein